MTDTPYCLCESCGKIRSSRHDERQCAEEAHVKKANKELTDKITRYLSQAAKC